MSVRPITDFSREKIQDLKKSEIIFTTKLWNPNKVGELCRALVDAYFNRKTLLYYLRSFKPNTYTTINIVNFTKVS